MLFQALIKVVRATDVEGSIGAFEDVDKIHGEIIYHLVVLRFAQDSLGVFNFRGSKIFLPCKKVADSEI